MAGRGTPNRGGERRPVRRGGAGDRERAGGREPRGGGRDRADGRTDRREPRPHPKPRPGPGGSRPPFAAQGPVASRPERRPARRTTARELALRVLFETESRAAFADRLLDRQLAESHLSDPDRRLATQIVQGTLRYQRRLDHVLEQLLKGPRPDLPIWIRLCLRMGAFQLLFLDRVPRHAVVDETVALAHKYGHPGTAGLVNAVLRRLPEALAEITFPDPEQDLVAALGVVESHPDWIVRRWLARYGREATEALLRANNRPSTVTIRVNRRRTHPQALLRLLRLEGVTAEPGHLSPYCLRLAPGTPVFTIPAFHAGLFTVQDEAESLVVPLLNPRPGERVLDLCAGPGGKLGHLLEWSRGEARVVGVEIAPSRLRKVREMLARLGEKAALVVADGRQFGRPGSFDRVLVDAPCSGLGVLRRRADARWRKTPDIFADVVPLQAELLDRAAELVAPAGVLVYSVCSFEPEECGEQVAKFLARHPDWALERPGPGIDPAVVNKAGAIEVRHDPWDTDGVFAARFRRAAAIAAEGSGEEWPEDLGDDLGGDPPLAPSGGAC